MTDPRKKGMDMIDLIERLEKADGPDRELDHAIHALMGGADDFPGNEPRYTSSIDAARTLGPKGWICLVRDHNGKADYDGEGEGAGGFASLYRKNVKGPIFTAYAQTPAIALTIAALKSIAAMADTPKPDRD